jgi:anthranilate phosphoribosyltransferase
MAFLDYLHRVAARSPLSAEEAEQAMGLILEGQASVSLIAAFLVALRMKGETTGEILGFARAMRARSLRVDVSGIAEPLLDTCGTGGDSTGSFNISTVTALVVAGAGVRVAKHGNRSMASHCGSADILEALGVKIALSPAGMADCIRRAGIGFLFAPALHPAMKYAQPARAEIKMRTALNLLGPLTNPAGARFQLIGAPSESGARLMAEALAELGTARAFVVHGSDGMDEITTTGSTLVFEVAFDRVAEYVWQPRDFGIPRASLSDFAAPTKDDNVRIARAVLAEEMGPCRDIVVINAAAALLACGEATSLRQGVLLAESSIDSGAARKSLEKLIHVSTTTAS